MVEGSYQRGGFTHGMTEGYPAHEAVMVMKAEDWPQG